MGERNPKGIVDLGGRGEGGIEPLRLEVADQRVSGSARHLVAEIAPRERAPDLGTGVQREGGRAVKEELVDMVVGDNDPDVGFERGKRLADPARDLAHAFHGGRILGFGHRKELRRMGNERTAQHVRRHGFASGLSLRGEV